MTSSTIFRVLTDHGDAVYERHKRGLFVRATRRSGGSWIIYEADVHAGKEKNAVGTVADANQCAVFDALPLPPVQSLLDALNDALRAGEEDEALRLGSQIKTVVNSAGVSYLHAPVRDAFVLLLPIIERRRQETKK